VIATTSNERRPAVKLAAARGVTPLFREANDGHGEHWNKCFTYVSPSVLRGQSRLHRAAPVRAATAEP